MKHIILAALILSACTTVPVVEEKPKEEATTPTKSSCEMVKEALVLQNQTVTLPAKGKMVLESHLVTREDKDTLSGLWPTSVVQGVSRHNEISCALLKKKIPNADCASVYSSKYSKEWTPAEGGQIGQGSSSIPPLEHEVWSGNMYFTAKNKPKLGVNDRFLACANSKCVVVTTSYEIGPGDKGLLGGLQTEPMWYLGANNNTLITWGRLKDQSIPLGPVICNNAK